MSEENTQRARRFYISENNFGEPVIGGAGIVSSAGYLEGYWKNKRELTIDSSLIDDTLTDFPVLVKLDSTNISWNKVDANGSDIRFYSTDESTFYQYEIVSWDVAGNNAEIWVKIPSISSSEDTTFDMLYNNTDNPAGSDFAGSVWDADYLLVWHLEGNYNDSTNNNYSGANQGATAIQGGKIGSAYSFDGVNDYGELTNTIDPDDYSGLTIEGWWYARKYDGWDYNAFGWGETTGFGIIGVGLRDSDTRRWVIGGDNDYDEAINLNQWYHTVLRTNRTTDYLFIDGIEKDTHTPSKAMPFSDNDFRIGNVRGELDRPISGTLDEIRISKVYRSNAWIKASFNAAAGSLISYGGEV